MSNTRNKFSPEARARAVRMILDHEGDYPTRLSAQARQDVALKPEIARVFAENFAVYSVCKVWRQMMREGFLGARCTVTRLMHEMDLAGAIRGKPVRTTISHAAILGQFT